MQIRIISSGTTGEHTTIFPNVSFSNNVPTKEWLLENGVEEVVQSYTTYEPDLVVIEAQRIESLWQAAHNTEFAAVSGSAIGLLAMGVLQGKEKCTAVQMWIKNIWTEYYVRKASGSSDTDFSFVGSCPYTVPELMAELGL